MNIYDKLEQLSLTESEKTLIDYVIEHSEDIMNMSASDISKNSYVSVSTIYRIIDKLELSGLQAFKSHIHFDRERYHKELVSVDYNYPFRINNTNHEIMTKMLNLYDQTLHSTLNLVNLDEFGKIVQKMYDANAIALFPSIGNFFMAECFMIIRKEQHRQSHKVHHLYHQLHHQSKNQNIHNCTTSWVVFLYYHDIGDNVSNIMKGAEKLWP